MRYKIRGEVTPALLATFDGIDADTDETIVIDIHSPGGDVSVLHYGINILQRAKRQGKKIITCNSGIALSAGATFLFQGDEIYIGDTSIVMLHRSRLIYGSFADLVMDKADHLIRWFKRERDVPFTEISDEVLLKYEPWVKVLDHYKDKAIRGDYFLVPEQLAELFDNVKVEDMPDEYANMDLWEAGDETIIDPADLPPDVQAAIEEAMNS